MSQKKNCKKCGSSNISVLPNGVIACFHCNTSTAPEYTNPEEHQIEGISKSGGLSSTSIATTQKESNIITIKDSGKKYTNENGGQRDIDEGKFDPAYIPTVLINMFCVDRNYYEIFFKCKDIRLGDYNSECEFRDKLVEIINMCFKKSAHHEQLEKFAIFLEVASKKYSFDNWKKLTSNEDFYRFRRSLIRHAFKCLMGYTDEPHHEAIIFNAVCLLSNFDRNEKLILSKSEPLGYSLTGLTDADFEIVEGEYL